MSTHLAAGARIAISSMSDGSVSAYIEYILDATEGVMVRTVDFELEPIDEFPGSKEWMKEAFVQLVELL